MILYNDIMPLSIPGQKNSRLFRDGCSGQVFTFSREEPFARSGSWARMMAANMSTQPRISRPDMLWPRMTQPARTEITDSRLSTRLAMVGLTPYCPMICRV